MRLTRLAGVIAGAGFACLVSAARARASACAQMTYLTVEAFAKAIDAKDSYTAGHSERVTEYALVLATAMNLPAASRETLRRAAMLHDIGKVGVPDDVLLKAAPLEPAERAIIESHATIGWEMLRDLPFLSDALPAIRGHHERWDGRGYPDRLAGDCIHQHARLMAVADSFDAMTSARPYRAALSPAEAARRLRADAGRQFDPAVVTAFDRAEVELCALALSDALPAGQPPVLAVC